MGYGVEIMPLDKVIEWADTLKNSAVERASYKIHDEDLQVYRDYQYSLYFYLKELSDIKKIKK